MYLKVYFNIAAMFVLGVLMLGFVWPFLFSADSAELVAVGVVSGIIVPPLYFLWCKKVVNMIANNKGGKDVA